MCAVANLRVARTGCNAMRPLLRETGYVNDFILFVFMVFLSSFGNVNLLSFGICLSGINCIAGFIKSAAAIHLYDKNKRCPFKHSV